VDLAVVRASVEIASMLLAILAAVAADVAALAADVPKAIAAANVVVQMYRKMRGAKVRVPMIVTLDATIRRQATTHRRKTATRITLAAVPRQMLHPAATCS
jgi:uncharacterized membrane protein